MKHILKKLLLGKPETDKIPLKGSFEKRISNIRSIWNNEHKDDVGIEKLLRLFLAVSQFAFPGIYIKAFFGRMGIGYQELSVDFFVLLKIVFPFVILFLEVDHNPFLYAVMIWFLIETVLYLATLVFASDIFSRPRSYRRTMLLLFLNYLQIVLSYAVIYTHINCLNLPFTHWFDSVYFSLMTSSTVGYGDYYPVTFTGKLLVSSQVLIFFIVVVMFLGFFSNKLDKKGYFDPSDNADTK